MRELHAHYEIVYEESTDDVLVIRDLGPWFEFPTVTNDAEHVVRTLTNNGFLHHRRRLHYYDSAGQLDEITHNGVGRFTGFRPIVKQSKPAKGDYINITNGVPSEQHVRELRGD